MREVFVSIVCLCYNHEKYIKNALDGFLNQRTDFLYEVIVHDDASDDQSAKIIKEYMDRYPQIVRGIFQNQNLMGQQEGDLVYKLVFNECKGKYVAFCEGDDYWLDRNKLQIQIDYMEKNKDCAMTAHNGLRIDYIDGSVDVMNPYDIEKDISIEELIMQYNGNLPTASLVVRKEYCKLENIYAGVGVGDILLQMYCITKGKVHYIDRIMSLYRYAHANSWTSRTMMEIQFRTIHYIKMLKFLDGYNESTKYTYAKIIRKKYRYYIDIIVDTYKGLSLDKFDKVCEHLNMKTNGMYNEYCEKLFQIIHFMFDMFYISDKIRKMMEEYPHILIMGAGEYGKRLAIQLNNNGYDFEGFVISDNQEISSKIDGKNIWHLKNIPYEMENTGIIVAVNYSHWEELEVMLKERHDINYVYPFEL